MREKRRITNKEVQVERKEKGNIKRKKKRVYTE